MSSLYTTKSLGRTWLPSPVRNQRARYGTWPTDTPKLRWLSTENQRSKRWSKIHERFVLAAGVLVLAIWWWTFGRRKFLSINTPWPLPVAETNNLSEFAYVTYASNTGDLCSSLMLLESLHRLGVQAAMVLLYPDAWNFSADSTDGQLFRQAQEAYGAAVQSAVVPQWDVDVAVLASNQTAYKRVMALNPDATILRSMDELFFSKSLAQGGGGAAVMLSPFSSLLKESKDEESVGDIIAGHSSTVPWIFQTNELRQTDHSASFSSSSSSDSWSAKSALVDANLVHFSDGPPWKPLIGTEKDALLPTCPEQEQCEGLDVWRWLYTDFRARRKDVCGAQFNEWEVEEAREEANRRIMPLQDLVNGVGGLSGAAS